jgi:AraC family transcriptional regulator
MVWFLPAGCNRDLVLRDVAWEWEAIAIDPAIAGDKLSDMTPFRATSDDFIYTTTAELCRLFHRDGKLDASYCSTMAMVMREYQAGGYQRRRDGSASHALTQWQVRSPTWPRRSAFRKNTSSAPFRGSTGVTSLQAIFTRRMERPPGC